MQERRKTGRVGVSFPVEASSDAGKNFFFTVSKDISKTGVKILSTNQFNKGVDLRLNINLINKIVDVLARVAWCNKERASERYSVGLEFVEIDALNRQSLNGFLSKVY